MSKDAERTLDDIVREAIDISSAVGRASIALGMRIAPIQGDPKHVAMELLKSGEEFKAVSAACNKLAADICEIDAVAPPKIQTLERGPLVGTNLKPLI